MAEQYIHYHEVHSDGSNYKTSLGFKVSDFDKQREDPNFTLRGTVVPNPDLQAKMKEEFEAECNIARLGDSLGFASTYDSRTGQWSVERTAPQTQASQEHFQLGDTQAAASALSSSSKLRPHCSIWDNTVPDTSTNYDNWDKIPLMRPWPEVPEDVERLALKISKLPRGITTQLPQRNLLKNSGFWPHFDTKNGVLLRTSPLFRWYGDNRLFPMETWYFLVNPSTRTK